MALFFYFVKMTIAYLLLRLIFCQGFELLANSQSNYLKNIHPSELNFNGLTALSIWPSARFLSLELLEIQSFINLIYILVLIPFFIIYRIGQNRYCESLHADRYRQEDYSIMVENIPFFSFLQTQTQGIGNKLPPFYELLHLNEEKVNPSEVINTDNANIIISEAVRLFFTK
jgi:hypothetical protein